MGVKDNMNQTSTSSGITEASQGTAEKPLKKEDKLNERNIQPESWHIDRTMIATKITERTFQVT